MARDIGFDAAVAAWQLAWQPVGLQTPCKPPRRTVVRLPVRFLARLPQALLVGLPEGLTVGPSVWAPPKASCDTPGAPQRIQLGLLGMLDCSHAAM